MIYKVYMKSDFLQIATGKLGKILSGAIPKSPAAF